MKHTRDLRENGLLGVFNAPAFSMFAVAVLSIWVYWRALGFAFFNDDPTGHFRWMEDQSLLQFFGSAVGQGYYRPIIFVTLKSIWALFGGYNAVAFHALLVLLHAVNTALLWRLAAYLGQAPYAWLVAPGFCHVSVQLRGCGLRCVAVSPAPHFLGFAYPVVVPSRSEIE